MAAATQIIEPEIKRLLKQGRSPYRIEALLTERYGYRVITARNIYKLKRKYNERHEAA